MTISPLHNISRKRASAGHTLVEVLIAATLASVMLAAVVAIGLMAMRSGVRSASYSDMETETRTAFQKLGIDARTANAFSSTFVGSQVSSITLMIPSSDYFSGGFRYVTYGYDSSAKTIFSVPGNDPTATTGRAILIRNVISAAFLRYNQSSAEITGTSNTGIKHIQVSVTVARGGSGGVVQSIHTTRSTAFTLRNI
ncbi:MAG: prepilin-type N-terminal cleavage/methylation domain-containing protein [Nibricoccus sp.]